MPSSRRLLLASVSTVTIGIAGCSGLPTRERSAPSTETPANTDDSTLYEPTKPDSNTSAPRDPPEYRVQTPATIRGWNRQNESVTAWISLEIGTTDNRTEVLNETVEFQAGDQSEIAEFEQHGQYHFTVEVADERYSETVYVWPQDLADCNVVSPTIEFEPSSVSIGVGGTDAGCPPLTATSNATGSEP